MWAPWRRTPPGTVRVKARDLVETLRGALRAAELEAEIRDRAAEGALLEAEARALELAGTKAIPSKYVDRDSLPLKPDRMLHEEAFLALCEARVWQARDLELANLLEQRKA